MTALVTIRDGEVRASSVDIASTFDKTHRDVVRAIDSLIERLGSVGREDVRSFAHISVKDRYGRPQRAYEMDRDGFSLLAMGFTGPKALEWKLKFLEAFRRMEEALSKTLAGNDNGLDQLHPLLQTADGRDALWKGREQVRLMKELRGRDAAMALWLELRLPLPKNFDAMLEHGNTGRREPLKVEGGETGEMHAWIAARKVRVSEGCVLDRSVLFADYCNWCFANDLATYDPDKFVKHLRIHFGRTAERKRGMFAIEFAAA